MAPRAAAAGTIMPNKHEELWAVLDALNPGCLGDYKAFSDFYSKPIRKGQSSTAAEYEVQKVRG
jgi:SNF2 family DNA or RNA helicase